MTLADIRKGINEEGSLTGTVDVGSLAALLNGLMDAQTVVGSSPTRQPQEVILRFINSL